MNFSKNMSSKKLLTSVGVGVGVYGFTCIVIRRIFGCKDEIVPHSWNRKCGEMGNIVAVLHNQYDTGILDTYLCPKFLLFNPFQYFTYLKFKHAKEESYKLGNDAGTLHGNGDRGTVFTFDNDAPDKIPLYYIVSGYGYDSHDEKEDGQTLKHRRIQITNIETVYGSRSKDLLDCTIYGINSHKYNPPFNSNLSVLKDNPQYYCPWRFSETEEKYGTTFN